MKFYTYKKGGVVFIYIFNYIYHFENPTGQFTLSLDFEQNAAMVIFRSKTIFFFFLATKSILYDS